MKKYYCAALSSVVLLSACQPPADSNALSVTVSNPAKGSGLPQVLTIPLKTPVPIAPTLRSDDGSPVELIDDNNDQQADKMRLQVTLEKGQTKTINFVHDDQYRLADMAHVELGVRTGGQWQDQEYVADDFQFNDVEYFASPEQLTDHSYFLRYEGPGWENDQIGYRLYLDWRNAIDIFGKKVNKISLPKVGLDGYESYHHESDWGLDVLKVGKALGVGALGRLVNGEVIHFQQTAKTEYQLLENANLSAAFSIKYSGWNAAEQPIDVTTRYRINAGDAATQIMVNSSKAVDNLVTGLVKHPNTSKLSGQADNWAYIARYGQQSLAGDDDELGFALFYRRDQVAERQDGQYDDLVVFKPSTGDIEYQIMAIWPQGNPQINSQADFTQRLNDKLNALEHPVQLQ